MKHDNTVTSATVYQSLQDTHCCACKWPLSRPYWPLTENTKITCKIWGGHLMKRVKLWSESPGTGAILLRFQNEALTLPNSLPALVVRWTRKMLGLSDPKQINQKNIPNLQEIQFPIWWRLPVSGFLMEFLDQFIHSITTKEQLSIFACSHSLHPVPLLAFDGECTPACTLR